MTKNSLEFEFLWDIDSGIFLSLIEFASSALSDSDTDDYFITSKIDLILFLLIAFIY